MRKELFGCMLFAVVHECGERINAFMIGNEKENCPWADVHQNKQAIRLNCPASREIGRDLGILTSYGTLTAISLCHKVNVVCFAYVGFD